MSWAAWLGLPLAHNIWLYNLPYNIGYLEQELERKFDEFGDVVSARVVRNPVNMESRGFGFVEMKTEDGTEKVDPCAQATEALLSNECYLFRISMTP